jgi:hypothetical protein
MSMEDQGVTELLLRSRVMSLWPSPVGHCTDDEQHERLQRFLLDEIWVHYLIYSEHGIDLPDSLYSTDRYPSWRQLRQPPARRLSPRLVWLPDNAAGRPVNYMYDAEQDRYVQQVLDV